MGYARSPFRVFESYLRIIVGSGENDVQSFLKQDISSFVTGEIPPSVYSTKDSSEIVYTMGDHEGTLQIESDDVSMKTKLLLTHFGGTSGTRRINEKPLKILYQVSRHIGIKNLLMPFMLIGQVYNLVKKCKLEKNNRNPIEM